MLQLKHLTILIVIVPFISIVNLVLFCRIALPIKVLVYLCIE